MYRKVMDYFVYFVLAFITFVAPVVMGLWLLFGG
jgi:hypothetical protein